MQVSKWGNSLAVRLPKKLVEDMGLKPGDELAVVEVADRTIVVAKDQRRAKAIANMRARGWQAPADFKFDRDEANKR